MCSFIVLLNEIVQPDSMHIYVCVCVFELVCCFNESNGSSYLLLKLLLSNCLSIALVC